MEVWRPFRHHAGGLPMAAIIWPLLIYWLVLFVACFVVVEVGHDQLYDEVTPHAGLKVAGGSLLIAILLTTLRWAGFPASFESMFTTNIIWTLLQAIVWAGVFVLIFQFHPWHGLGLGLATMLLVTGLATMGVESLLAKPTPTTQSARSTISNQPVRQSVSPMAPAAPARAPGQTK
jgi:magnesium-transporting ATPase (P-type)